MLIDESGCLLAPLVRRTLAPRGCTPILHQRARQRDKVSVVAALSLSPLRRRLSLFFRTYPNQYINSEKSAAFLRELLKHLRGQVIVVWDGGGMHKGQPIRDLLKRFPRLWLERLPPYAPDLNPVEPIWKHVKYDELCNFAPQTTSQLDQELRTRLTACQRDPARLKSFYDASELPRPRRIVAR